MSELAPDHPFHHTQTVKARPEELMQELCGGSAQQYHCRYSLKCRQRKGSA